MAWKYSSAPPARCRRRSTRAPTPRRRRRRPAGLGRHRVEARAGRVELRADVREGAEVRDAQALRVPAAQDVQRRVPGLHVDVGRRRRGQDRARRRSGRRPRRRRRPCRPPRAGRRRGGRRGPGRRRRGTRPDVAGQRPGRALEDADVGRRHRHDLAPQAVEVVAVEPPRAGHEALGVDEVRRAALVDPDLRAGPAPQSAPVAPAWSKWMWVSRIARGTSPSSASSSARWLDSGPGSTRTSPTWWQQMTRGAQVVDVDLAVLRHPGGVPYDPGTP